MHLFNSRFQDLKNVSVHVIVSQRMNLPKNSHLNSFFTVLFSFFLHFNMQHKQNENAASIGVSQTLKTIPFEQNGGAETQLTAHM